MRRVSWKRRALLAGGLLATGLAGVVYSTTDGFSAFGARNMGDRKERIRRSPNFNGKAFQNLRDVPTMLPGTLWKTLWSQVSGGEERKPRKPFAVAATDAAVFAEALAGGLRVTWLGHSTTLIEVDGYRVLTDPVWSQRASPSSLAGPARFHAPPLPLENLPELDAITISHDHYDHLDMETIRALARTSARFFVPLGVGAHLETWGVSNERITELDWWEEATLEDGGLRLAAVPAQHYSGRGLGGVNATLWASWVLTGPRHRVYAGCDSGLFPGFAEIGTRYGPFDLALLPIGQYGPTWPDIHSLPEEAVDANRALRGRLLLPIHWGTFNLAFHDWREPGERLVARARDTGTPLLLPRPGETLAVPEESSPTSASRPWWREPS